MYHAASRFSHECDEVNKEPVGKDIITSHQARCAVPCKTALLDLGGELMHEEI